MFDLYIQPSSQLLLVARHIPDESMLTFIHYLEKTVIHHGLSVNILVLLYILLDGNNIWRPI